MLQSIVKVTSYNVTKEHVIVIEDLGCNGWSICIDIRHYRNSLILKIAENCTSNENTNSIPVECDCLKSIHALRKEV